MSANLNLKPKVVRMMNDFTATCAKAGIHLIVTQGLRTIAEQDALYAQGRTKPGKIVTQAKGGQSFHNFGVAFDVAGYDGKALHYDLDWAHLGKIAATIGLEHGDRGYVDLPHFQYRAGHSLEDFQKNRVDPKQFS